MSSKVYDKIADQIIAAIEESGELPWQRPWDATGADAPVSVHGRAYRGINRLILGLESMRRGYEDNRWITFKQAAKAGGKLKEGIHRGATPVILWKPMEKEVIRDGKAETERFFITRYYNVFNVEQWNGLDYEKVERDHHEWDEIEECEKVLSEMPQCPRINHAGVRAFYSPVTDEVTMPAQDRFENPEDYYGVLFHELAHSTGHQSRLNRKGITEVTGFGSEDYSQEELVAEISSAFVCGRIGIDTPKRQGDNVNYVAHWLKVLKADKKMIVYAAQRASKAADWIFNEKGD